MDHISGYRIEERLDETLNSVVYRARSSEKGDPVIIKSFRAEYPTPAEIARLKHEYELIRGIHIDGVVKVLDMIDVQGGVAIVMEDFGGVSLKEVLRGGFSLQRFLELALRIAEILGQLHQRGISHRDIKPGNIIINQDKDILKLTDFGIAAEFTRRNEQIYDLKVMEGTLAYISPEQTGRINCAVDYRTDLYSLGVSFYEMLTGNLPFLSSDPMEIIHAHIAKTPLSPSQINPVIPQMISAVVMKLMAKSPDERYQNSFGLRYDLEECLNRLKQSGDIAPFELGRHDVSLRFNIPQMIVGREKELGLLKDAFDRVSTGSKEIMLIAGEPGIGKSALVGELHRPIIEKHGYYLSGKYDHLRRNVPYSAIIQAFTALAKQLLSESEELLSKWRKWFLAALSPNGKIVVDAIPEMGNIIGPQPDIPELGPTETQNRFQMVMKSFVRVFSQQGHPLVMFLDDLQWADSASLDLIKIITTDHSLKHFLLIGAYRDTETPAHHPLMLTLEEMRKSMVVIQTVSLHQLDAVSVNILIAHFLRVEPQTSEPLAKITHVKTLGNPFFVIQFLKTLYEDKYLNLDASSQWKWDIHVIEELQVTDNVVELMAGKIARLPADQQDLIEVCACVGNRFDIETLCDVIDRPVEEILSTMDALIREGLINYSNNLYRFHHDRIQEAAYSLLTPAERERNHLQIGTLSLRRTPADKLFNQIFYIVDQLNQGRGLIYSQSERNRLAQLNLQAGVKAKESTAYAAAVSYLGAGIELLGSGTWQTDYRLTLDIYNEKMECHYLDRNFEEAERLFRVIIARAQTKIDKAKAYNTMLVLYTVSRPPREAIALGIEALNKLFGIKLSINISKGLVTREMNKAKQGIEKIGLDNVLNLPRIQNMDILAAHELMLHTSLATYYVSPNLNAFITLKGVNDSLEYGLMPHSAVAFINMANLIQSSTDDYDLSYRVGKMALKLNEKLGNQKIMCMVLHIFAFFIQHWRKHIKNDLDIYARVYEAAINAGDFIISGHSITAAAEAGMRIRRLDDILDDLKKYQEFMKTLKDILIVGQYHQLITLIQTIKGKNPDDSDLSGDGLDMAYAVIAWLRNEGNYFGLCFALIQPIMILSMYGNYEKALEHAEELDKHIHLPIGTLLFADHYFYYSLLMTALLRQGETKRKREFNVLLRRNQRKMHKWATLCPENFRHKYDLVAAEIAGVAGRSSEALKLYHAAIEGARQNEFLHDEARACECLANFYFSNSFRGEAELFIQRASQLYRIWGAQAKVKKLQEQYPDIIRNETRPANETSGSTTTIEATASLLDLATVMRVSQAISSEIVLERLMQKIMKIAVVNAGAQSGYLMLDNNGQLTIEAALEEGAEEGRVMNSLPIEKSEELCQAIVNYVDRSQQNLILANAIQEGDFMDDPYIRRKKCKSILCAPILNTGKLSGIIYMENNLIANAFTPERLELLRIILSQAAISLDNAKLFELATTDGLTKLYVHRYFQLLLDSEMQRFERYRRPLSLIMLDIDNFKRFNDTYGHQLGDDVLRNVARTVKSNTRKTDFVARYGGEEFVVIMPETNTTGAMAAAEKICAAVAAIIIPHGEEKLHVTISLGVASLSIHASDKESLIRAADEALYVSKRLGKNRASVAGATFVIHQN